MESKGAFLTLSWKALGKQRKAPTKALPFQAEIVKKVRNRRVERVETEWQGIVRARKSLCRWSDGWGA